jgi:hypothetical protein
MYELLFKYTTLASATFKMLDLLDIMNGLMLRLTVSTSDLLHSCLDGH